MDEYFKVTLHSTEKIAIYVADQIDGLIKLIEHIFQLYNISNIEEINKMKNIVNKNYLSIDYRTGNISLPSNV
jgi:hypothetical protein